MKIKTVIETEDGQVLTDPKDGFLIQGSIRTAMVDGDGRPNGELLVGTCLSSEASSTIGATCLSLREFIKALKIDPYKLRAIATELMPHERGDFNSKV